jgi:hypothetical protein
MEQSLNRKRMKEIVGIIGSFSFTELTMKMKNDYMYVFNVINVRESKTENTFAIIISGNHEKPYFSVFDVDRNIYIGKTEFSEFFDLLSVEQKEEVLYHLDIF